MAAWQRHLPGRDDWGGDQPFLADAERSLLTKTTKAAQESKRIAANKIEAALVRLASLRSPELAPDDLRIFPGYWAPVIVMEAGRHLVKPMR